MSSPNYNIYIEPEEDGMFLPATLVLIDQILDSLIAPPPSPIVEPESVVVEESKEPDSITR